MSWKKSLAYFTWQSLRFSKNTAHFWRIWSYKKRWLESFQKGRNSVSDELPWLNFPAIEYLQALPLAKYKVFEFGGGGSTLFFCKNDAHVSTVEDNLDWFNILTETVSKKGYKNWRGYHIAPEPYSGTRVREPHNPDDFLSGGNGLGHLSFERYARCIDGYADHYFDMVLVDGRVRPSCIKQALPKLKSGGFLVVDNTERPYYLVHFKDIIKNDFDVELDEYAPVAYTPDFTKTTILRKR